MEARLEELANTDTPLHGQGVHRGERFVVFEATNFLSKLLQVLMMTSSKRQSIQVAIVCVVKFILSLSDVQDCMADCFRWPQVSMLRCTHGPRIIHWLQAGFLRIYSNIWSETVERYEKSSLQELQHQSSSNIQKVFSTTEFHDHALLIAIARELP